MERLEKFRDDVKVMLKSGFSKESCTEFLRARGCDGNVSNFVDEIADSLGDFNGKKTT